MPAGRTGKPARLSLCESTRADRAGARVRSRSSCPVEQDGAGAAGPAAAGSAPEAGGPHGQPSRSRRPVLRLQLPAHTAHGAPRADCELRARAGHGPDTRRRRRSGSQPTGSAGAAPTGAELPSRPQVRRPSRPRTHRLSRSARAGRSGPPGARPSAKLACK